MLWRSVALCLSVLLLAGCWDRREINDIAFVVASAVDREGDQFRATLQIALPGQMAGAGGKGGGGGTSGRRTYLVDSEVAPSIREANNNQQKALSRQLYFAHRRVFLIGEEAARAGIEPIVDVLARVPQNRLTSFVVVAQGEARDILTVDAPIEQFPAEMVREMAVNAMARPQTLKTVVEAMINDGRDPVIPLIAVRQTEPGAGKQPESLLEVKGLAVFRDDKLVELLEDKEAMGLLWALGQARVPTVAFRSPVGDGNISVQFTENQVELIPVVQGDKITVTLVVWAKGSVVENNARYSLGTGRNLAEFESDVGRQVEAMVKRSITAVQERGADPLGIGELIHRHYPSVWHRISKRWPERYPDVRFEVVPRIHLAHPGALVEPFGVKAEDQKE